MGDPPRPYLKDRLRLVESLLRAVEDGLPPLQRLLSEIRHEIGLALQDEIKSGREEELAALRLEVEQLREGLGSRSIIERAKGILMQGRGITESQSFDLLTALSQCQRRKVRDVAADIATGSLPPHQAVVPSDRVLPDPAVRGGRRSSLTNGRSGTDDAIKTASADTPPTHHG
jgi:hypothetical protein